MNLAPNYAYDAARLSSPLGALCHAARAGLLGAVLVTFPSCLSEPPIEERWTLLEIVEASPMSLEAFQGSAPVPVTVRARITYREILTGFLVVELRESVTLADGDTRFELAEHYLDIARDVDLVLANSTAIGSDTVPVTGFDHLIQEIDLSFEANPAQGAQASPRGSEGRSPRASAGLFLVLYFSDDVEEVELESGEEIEVIDPVLSTEADILSTGRELVPESPGV